MLYLSGNDPVKAKKMELNMSVDELIEYMIIKKRSGKAS